MKALPKEIHKATNQAAHRLAMQHESRVRDLLLTRLTANLNTGANLPALFQTLQKYEKEQSGGTL